MLKTNTQVFFPDITEIINLFPLEASEIEHICDRSGNELKNVVTVNGKKYEYFHIISTANDMETKRLTKRYVKLSVYSALSDYYGKKMPWGALTGIRPTKLCYREGAEYKDFLKNTMLVSDEKVSLCEKIIEAQKGIYERNDNNCDLFVGIPFCPSRCLYCSFVSSEISKSQYVEQYADALIKEIEAAKPLIKKLRSVYVGGGTPVSLPKQTLNRILDAIGDVNCEYTVEAGRPDCIDEEILDILKKHGVNRICVNPQTFSDKTLELLGRKHTAKDVIEKYNLVKSYGFVVNMDLIAGLTGETLSDFIFSLNKAAELQPDNITVHSLCLKSGSKLKETTTRLDDGAIDEMINYAHKTLEEKGYSPYYLYRQKYMAGNLENTGYCLKDKQCIYNIDVMEETAQNIACGANAVSKRVIADEDRIERYGAPKDIKTYIDKINTVILEKKALFG